jgi:glycosyltransferase involved in cell wall biosynthesis
MPTDFRLSTEMEKLKFLFTTSFYPPYHIGGDAVHVQYLAKELANQGHDVHVLHSLDAYYLKRKVVPQKTVDQIKTYEISTRFKRTAYQAYFCGSCCDKKFTFLLKQINPDVVHHHNISLLGYTLLKKKSYYLNLYTAHDYWLICQKNDLTKYNNTLCEKPTCFTCSMKCKKAYQLWRKKSSYKDSFEDIDLLIAPSKYLRDRLMERIALKSLVIPNFVPTPPELISNSSFSNFFLYAGVLEKHKGILNLIETFSSNQINSKLVIVGDGTLKKYISVFIKLKNLQSKIIVLGWVDKNILYSLLKDANALILPSIWPENSPLITLEALSVGTPVIASNNGGLPEIVDKVDSGLVFDTLAKLEDILINYSKKDYPSTDIKKVYYANFSASAYIDKYIATIRNCLNDN